VNDPHVAVESESEHRVTPLELFFDLVFVFAITQVTSLLADDPTWTALLRGMLVLAAVWWTWTGYAWLTSAIDVDEGGVRLAVLAALIAMLFVALAVPGSFGDDAVLFGAALLVVRVLHIGLAFIASREDVASRDAIMRTAPTATAGAALILVAGFFDGPAQAAIWVVALALGYLGPVVMGLGRGWRLAPEHFTERTA
jgi:low temperature requirement protein LtrA